VPSIRSILRAPFTAMKSAGASMFPRGGWGMFSVPRGAFNYAQSVGDGLGSSVIVAPLRWLQRNFAEAPVRLRRRDGDDLTTVASHPFLTLLSRPNEHYSGTVLLKGTVASWELDGNAYWLIALNAQGRPVQAWYTPHTLVEPKRRDGSPNFIDYFEYAPGDGTTQLIAPIGFDRSDIPGITPGWAMLHFQDGIDPNNTMKGASGFRSLLREVFTDDEAAQFTASLLRNMGVPGLIISPADDGGGLAPVGEQDVKDTKAAVKAATTGDARGEPIIMTAPTKIQTIGFNPQELNLRDLRRIPEERVTAVMGIPAVVVGLGAGLDRSTFANMAEAKDSAYEDKILPMQRDLAETLWLKLLPQFEVNTDVFRVDFDLSEVRALQDDTDKKATRVTGLVNGGVLSLAEGRELLGQPVRDEHRVYRVPMNLIEVPEGQTMEQVMGASVVTEATTGREGGTGTGATATPPGDGDDAEPEPAGAKGAKRRVDAARQQRLIRTLQLQQATLEQAFAKRLVKRFGELGKHVAEEWAKVAPPMPAILTAPDPKATDDERARAERARAAGELAGAQLAAASKLLDALQIEEWQSTVLGAEYAKHYSLVASETFKALDTTFGVTVNAPDVVAEQIIRGGGRRVGMVYLDSQTKAAVYGAIADGRAQGWGVGQVERAIREYVEAGGRGRSVSARAMRIARTETLHAQRTSTLAAYEGSGAFSTVIAFDNRLGYDDDDCMARDGTEFTFAEAEAEADAEHPNGTLSFAPGEVVE
jgi:HK97 family phage portal protein